MPAKPHHPRTGTNHRNGRTSAGTGEAAADAAAGAPVAAERLVELMSLAVTRVAPDRLDEHLRRIAGNDVPAFDDELALAEAMMFALDLAVFTALPGRSTAVERLARQLRPAPKSLDARLVDAMGRSHLSLFVLDGPPEGGIQSARDLFTGAPLRIADKQFADIVQPAGVRLAARLVPFGDLFLTAGYLLPIDDSTLEAVRPHRSADGSGWSNATRAAEALFRHTVRHDAPQIPGLNVDAEGRTPFPLLPEDGPAHDLAHRLAEQAPQRWSDPDTLNEARSMAGDGDAVMDALQGADLARAMDRSDLADAYEHVLSTMLDALQRRIAIGQRGAAELLAWIEHEIDGGVSAGIVPESARALFRRLKQRSGPGSPGNGKGNEKDKDKAELERLRARIQGLRAKTIDQGCTEEEALAAAAKVAELLDRYGLSLSDLEIRQQTCEGFGVDTGRRQRAPIDDAINTIAAFCDCRAWSEVTPTGSIRHVFFGLPADVEGAHYLYDLIAATLASETAAFRKGELYRSHASGQRTSATRSFQVGMVHGIVLKLDRMHEERVAANASTGRDLVPVKDSVIDDEIDKLGLHFTTRARRARRVLSDAFEAGKEAGDAFELRPALHDGPAPRHRKRGS